MHDQELTHAIEPGSGGLSTETIAALRSVPILSTLDDCGIHCLDGATEKWLDRGETLLKQGEPTREFWILLEGTINISYSNPEGGEQVMHVLEPGTSFGEVPLLPASPATSSS